MDVATVFPQAVRWTSYFLSTALRTVTRSLAGYSRLGAPQSLPVHPVQLYSMLIMSVVVVALLRMVRRPHRDGGLFFLFLIAYGALRLVMVPLRQEALASMKSFSVAFVVIGVTGMVHVRSHTSGNMVATPRV